MADEKEPTPGKRKLDQVSQENETPEQAKERLQQLEQKQKQLQEKHQKMAEDHRRLKEAAAETGIRKFLTLWHTSVYMQFAARQNKEVTSKGTITDPSGKLVPPRLER
jgi:predicted nuclease with TOPRIM domain